jgi:hypothetical protein
VSGIRGYELPVGVIILVRDSAWVRQHGTNVARGKQECHDVEDKALLNSFAMPLLNVQQWPNVVAEVDRIQTTNDEDHESHRQEFGTF